MRFLVVGGVTAVTFVCLFVPKIAEDVRVSKADEDMLHLESLVAEYHGFIGSYPTTEEGLEVLISRPVSKPKPSPWRQVLKKVPMDPWGNGYRYRLHGSGDDEAFEIWSLGADGKPGTKDDLSSLDE